MGLLFVTATVGVASLSLVTLIIDIVLFGAVKVRHDSLPTDRTKILIVMLLLGTHQQQHGASRQRYAELGSSVR